MLGSDGTDTDADVIAGVMWADHGADVILIGFNSPDYSAALADALAYAWSKGLVLVGATGNNSSSAVTHPAGMPGVIGVSGTDQYDASAGSSNYGQDTFLGAPGVGITSLAARLAVPPLPPPWWLAPLRSSSLLIHLPRTA